MVFASILLVKKKHRRSSGSGSNGNTYLKVAADIPDMSPEDRHISAMQQVPFKVIITPTNDVLFHTMPCNRIKYKPSILMSCDMPVLSL